MMTYHLRIGVRPRGARVTDRGAAGHTLCGAAVPDYDATIRDGHHIVRIGWQDPARDRCVACFNQLMQMDFVGSAKNAPARATTRFQTKHGSINATTGKAMIATFHRWGATGRDPVVREVRRYFHGADTCERYDALSATANAIVNDVIKVVDASRLPAKG